VWSGVVRGVTSESTARVVALEFILDGTRVPARLVELRDVNLFEVPRRKSAAARRGFTDDEKMTDFAGENWR
jgi:hypothetical protein